MPVGLNDQPGAATRVIFLLHELHLRPVTTTISLPLSVTVPWLQRPNRWWWNENRREVGDLERERCQGLGQG
jgi:hypothetical protein